MNTNDLSNINTKIKNDIRKDNEESAKSFHEDILNYKLSLRKNKLQNKLMEIRLKKFKESNKMSTRQKISEYKKLFEVDKLKQIKEQFLEKDKAFLKEKKFVELIHIYSQNINHDENIQKIFDLNDKVILISLFNEIIKDINSASINFELFDYYLLILGNFFIYTKNIYENNNKDFINLFLNILNKNSNLNIYAEDNFDIINDTLWLIYLYLCFSNNNYLEYFPFIFKNIEFFFSYKFLTIMINFYEQKNKSKNFLSIVKNIVYSLLNIYLYIFEEIKENIHIIPNFNNISKDIMQNCFDNLMNILNYTLIGNIYDEIITDILTLLFSVNKNNLNFSKNKFFEILSRLYNTYKNENYDNNNIIQNLLIILNKLIDNYNNCNNFWDEVKDSNILPICIQYYLKNGSLINITLITLNLFFKYQINYNKIIIKCINYKLIEIVSDILINVENNEEIQLYCLNILLNAYYFLKCNIKNKEPKNIIKYFNSNDGLVPKLEQILLSQNKDIVQLSSDLHYNLTNDGNIKYLFNLQNS